MKLVFLDIPTVKAQRVQAYRTGLARLVEQKIAPVYESNVLPATKGAQLIRFLTHGYTAIPEQIFSVTETMPQPEFSLKHGPFVQYLASRDLRPRRTRAEEFRFPQNAVLDTDREAGEVAPSIVGVRFGIEEISARYETSLADIVESQLVYDQLRRHGQIERKERGHLVATYDAIKLTILGLERGAQRELDVTLEGFPSRRDVVTRMPHANIGAGRDTVAPLLNIHSGYDQQHTRNQVVYWMHGSVIKRDTPSTNARGTAQRTHLYLGDLVMLRLAEGIANKQYGVTLNHPLPRVKPELVMLAQRLAKDVLVIAQTNDTKDKPISRVPTVKDLSMILSTILAQPSRSVLLAQEQERRGLQQEYWNVARTSRK